LKAAELDSVVDADFSEGARDCSLRTESWLGVGRVSLDSESSLESRTEGEREGEGAVDMMRERGWRPDEKKFDRLNEIGG